jgi:sulfur transfer complex TusBCD TusB component (DsrH family)
MDTVNANHAFTALTRMSANSYVRVRDLAARVGQDVTDDADRTRGRDAVGEDAIR